MSHNRHRLTPLMAVKIGPLWVHNACVNKTFDSQRFGVSCDSSIVLVLCVQKKICEIAALHSISSRRKFEVSSRRKYDAPRTKVAHSNSYVERPN